MCGIAVDYRGDEILAIRGDKDHVLSKGNICPKSSGLQDVHTDPDRLRKPVKKIDGEWHEIGWDEAFDEVVGRLEAGENPESIEQSMPELMGEGGDDFDGMDDL